MVNLKTLFVSVLIGVVLTACASQSSQSTQLGPNNISVKDAWAQPTIGGMGTMNMGNATQAASSDSMTTLGMVAVYMTINNTGAAPDTLMSVTGEVAGSITLHETKDNNGMISMSELKDGLEIPANSTVTLKPASYHLMADGLKKALKVGDAFKLVLRFRSGTDIPVDVAVREP